MSDKHLNLFFSYNHDAELIENNLTRAWIVSLRMLSDETCNRFLHTLLEHHLSSVVAASAIAQWDFAIANLALQGNMDKKRAVGCEEKFVLAIASYRYSGLTEADGEDNNAPLPSHEEIGDSIPDAWIVDATSRYCFLIESKVGFNPVDDAQVIAHARDWLGIKTKALLQKCVVGLTWNHVAEAAVQVLTDASEYERMLLGQFIDFLGYFGYRAFKGLRFDELSSHPAFAIGGRRLSGLYHFDRLLPHPVFALSGRRLSGLYHFDRLLPPQKFRIG